MEKRRRRQFRLPASLGLRVKRRDASEDVHVDVEHAVLFRLGEIAPFAFQLGEFGEHPLRREAAPREVVPRLQIPEIRITPFPEFRQRLVAIKARPPLIQQLRVARKWTQQMLMVNLEKMLLNRQPFVLLQLRRRLARPLQPQVAHRALHEFLDLQHEHGCEVEIHMHAGKLGEHAHHIEIALHRMKPDPRHHRQPSGWIHVIRLVHVPHKNNICHAGWLTQRGGGREAGSCVNRLIQPTSSRSAFPLSVILRGLPRGSMNSPAGSMPSR